MTTNLHRVFTEALTSTIYDSPHEINIRTLEHCAVYVVAICNTEHSEPLRINM